MDQAIHNYRQEIIYRIKLQHTDGKFSTEKKIAFSIATVWYKTWWFKFLITFLLLIAIYFTIRNYINIKLHKQKQELELQNAVAVERARISTELHDDLGSGLSTIRILSQSLNGYGNAIGKSTEVEKISNHSNELIQKMREIVWALNNENDTLDQLISYIRLQTATLLDNVSIAYKFTITESIPEMKVTGGNRRHIQLLIKEAVHNIIKHAQASEVIFTIDITNAFNIEIYDNGKGIAEKNISSFTGNGIKNMKKHASALNGSLIIENHIGTKVKLSTPLLNLSHESVI